MNAWEHSKVYKSSYQTGLTVTRLKTKGNRPRIQDKNEKNHLVVLNDTFRLSIFFKVATRQLLRPTKIMKAIIKCQIAVKIRYEMFNTRVPLIYLLALGI